jgi:hypothetical protein
VGFIKRKGSRYCVHNDATGKVIKPKGRLRCYADRERAELVLAALDCHYTGRRCKTVARLLHDGALGAIAAVALGARKKKSKCDHAKRFHELVNMTPIEIRKWHKDPRSKCYSWKETRDRLPALAKLKGKPTSKWTSDDCDFAARVVSFNARMDGARKRDGCTDGYAISLRNWGRRVCGLPSSCKPKRR